MCRPARIGHFKTRARACWLAGCRTPDAKLFEVPAYVPELGFMCTEDQYNKMKEEVGHALCSAYAPQSPPRPQALLRDQELLRTREQAGNE